MPTEKKKSWISKLVILKHIEEPDQTISNSGPEPTLLTEKIHSFLLTATEKKKYKQKISYS